jgi:hypothetical protein
MPTATTKDAGTRIEEETSRYWEWLRHEEELFVSRANFFVVAESMLFAAFATLAAADVLRFAPLAAITATGVLISILWLHVAQLQRRERIRPLKAALADTPWFQRFLSSPTEVSPHRAVAQLLPVGLAVAWFVAFTGVLVA